MSNFLQSQRSSRIDSHQHFWLRERGDYDWLTPELAPIYRDFMPEDLYPLLKCAGVNKTILVQAAETDAETDFLLDIAEKFDFVAGVVAWIDMTSSQALSRLDELVKNQYFKGIRPMIENISDDCWMLRPELHQVYQYLIQNNLCFDALVKPRHLNALFELMLKFPDLKVVIDHGAKPEISKGRYSEWSTQLSQIASMTGAYCKFSGLITEAKSGDDFLALKQYADLLLDSFGADRLMWGSDWPVINLACSFDSWVAWSDSYFSQLSKTQRSYIWHRSATDFYNL